MTHDEFVKGVESGHVRARVNRGRLMRSAALMETGLRAGSAHIMWLLLWLGCVVAAIVAFVMWRSWAGLLLCAIALSLPPLIKREAEGFVIRRARVDRDFFERAVSEGLLSIEERST